MATKSEWTTLAIAGRVLYPRLITPQAFDKGTENRKYSLILLVPKDNKDLAPYSQKLVDYCKAEYEKGDVQKKPFFDGDKFNQKLLLDEKPEKPEYKGMWVFKPKLAEFKSSGEEQRPTIIGPNGEKVYKEGIIYGGCWASLTVRCGGIWKGSSFGDQLIFSLAVVKFEGHDSPLGGTGTFEDEIPEVSGTFGSKTPLAGSGYVDSDFNPGGESEDDDLPF